MFGESAVFEIYQKNNFSRVPFKQFELSILSPPQWKLILKTAARASVVGSPFSTVIGKISTFYNILLSTTFYALLMKIYHMNWYIPKSSSSTNFE